VIAWRGERSIHSPRPRALLGASPRCAPRAGFSGPDPMIGSPSGVKPERGSDRRHIISIEPRRGRLGGLRLARYGAWYTDSSGEDNDPRVDRFWIVVAPGIEASKAPVGFFSDGLHQFVGVMTGHCQRDNISNQRRWPRLVEG
jgi:hypothetical protein